MYCCPTCGHMTDTTATYRPASTHYGRVVVVTNSTTGTATNGFGLWDDRLYYTPASTWKEPELVVPKWWRWFDVFRTWAKPKLLRLLDGYRQSVRRVQERYPAQQRARRKRRAYVQALHAL